MDWLKKAGLYWRTARHLKPSQILARLVDWLVPVGTPKDGPPPAERPRIGDWVAPAARPNSLEDGWIFDLLNVRATWDAVVASPEQQELLWLYRFHDFEDLVAADAEQRRELHAEWIRRWIEAYPPMTVPAWDPYPISMRAGNWVRWALAGGTLDDSARASLARQMRRLARRLEYHLRGNHLLENAKALYLVGSFLAGAEADRWRARGRRLLLDQIHEQILPDGGHVERSPMYHALMLEAVQDCAAAARVYGDARTAEYLSGTIAKMDSWTWSTSHPDGGIPFFQDACHGVTLSPAELHRRSAQLLGAEARGRGEELPEVDWLTGYGMARRGRAFLIADMTGPFPGWQPGHAHAGVLSFELSLFGKRWIVNTGTSVYGFSSERQRQRGTLAHNTVALDGRDSSEMWGGFRVGRRAKADLQRVEIVRAQDGPPRNFLLLSARHNGYARLPGGGRLTRTWFLDDRGMLIRDEAPDTLPAIASFHLAAEVQIEQFDSQRLRLHHGGESLDMIARGGTLRVEETMLAPRFGVTVPSKVLRVDFRGSLETEWNWGPMPGPGESPPPPAWQC